MARKKRILQVIEYFDVAGAEVVVRDLMIHLPRYGWEVEVCALHNVGILGAELRKKGYITHFLNWTEEKLSNLEVMQRMNALVKDREFDLIHPHNVTPWYFSTCGTLFQKIVRCVSIHTFLTGKDKLQKMLMYIFLSRLASKMIIVNDEIAAQLRRFRLIDMSKVQTIMNGVDISDIPDDFDIAEKRKSLGVEPDDFVMGTIGHLYPEKNIEMQIKLVHALQSQIPNIKLMVAARPWPHQKSLEAYAQSLGVQDKVFFLGLRRDIPELLKTWDMFLMTSFSEATSLAVLEAMSSGLPVVVSDVGGNSKLVTHNYSGLLFDVNDFETAKNHILTIYHDEQQRKKFGYAAKIIGESYSIEKMVSRYDSVYQGLLC